MKTKLLLLMAGTALLLSAACSGDKKNEEGKTPEGTEMTGKILYRVNILETADATGYYMNIPEKARMAYLQPLFDNFMNGKVEGFTDENFSEKVNLDEFKAYHFRTDTIELIDDLKPEAMLTKIIKHDLKASDINAIAFLEGWYFNPKNYAIEKKLLGLAPSISVYVEMADGAREFKGNMDLFWIKF